MRSASQKRNAETILESLANFYARATDPRFHEPNAWINNYNSVGYFEGSTWIDYCLEGISQTKMIMEVITNGLVGRDIIDRNHAEIACVVFQALYKNNPTIKAHVNAFFGNAPQKIESLKSDAPLTEPPLNTLLYTKRIYDEGVGNTKPLEDDPKMIRSTLNESSLDIVSITVFNEENNEDHLLKNDDTLTEKQKNELHSTLTDTLTPYKQAVLLTIEAYQQVASTIEHRERNKESLVKVMQLRNQLKKDPRSITDEELQQKIDELRGNRRFNSTCRQYFDPVRINNLQQSISITDLAPKIGTPG